MLTTYNLTPLKHTINERYDGQLNGLINHIDNAMYMLYFLEEDAFSKKEVCNVVYALKNLKDAFQEVDTTLEAGEPMLQSYSYHIIDEDDEDALASYQELNLFL